MLLSVTLTSPQLIGSSVLCWYLSKPSLNLFLGKLGKKTNLFLLLLPFYYYYLSQIFQIAAFNSSSLYHEIFLSHEILKCGKIPWMPEDMAYCDGVSFVTWSEWGRWASNWTLVVFHWSRHCLPLNCSNGTVWTGEKAVKSNNVKKAVFTLYKGSNTWRHASQMSIALPHSLFSRKNSPFFCTQPYLTQW